jgi:sugar phosphate isomerase/epimerase
MAIFRNLKRSEGPDPFVIFEVFFSNPDVLARVRGMNLIFRHALALLCVAAATSGTVFSADTTGRKAGLGPSFKGPIGLQLYSLRDEFSKRVPETLAKVHGFGFENVELAGTYGSSPEDFKKLLQKHHLNAVSTHFPFDRLKDDLDAVVREAKTLGVEYAGCAWIPHEGDFDETECRNAAAVFNRAGEAFSRQGIKFFYHTHGYEFRPHGNGTLFDLFMAETKPEYVRLQMDVFWVAHPGQDPVKLFEKYGSRFELMHLKDMKKGLKGDFSGHTDVANDVALGTGQLNWPAILKAAEKAGVRWYFIEDESPSVTQQIPVTLRFLEHVRW